jgi:nitroreductase
MLDAIKRRRSIRAYTSQEVEDEKINEILKACMASPSARHERRWEFVVVKDAKTIQKLADMKIHSKFGKGANCIIVVCSEDWKYWLEDASIVAEHIYLEATNQGLGTCWVQVKDSSCENGADSESYVREILGIPSDVRVLCFFPIGYPALSLPEHGEWDEEKVHREIW